MLLSVATAIAISGCVKPYIEPTGTSIASIEFINDAPETMPIYLHGDSKECTDRMSAGFVQPKAQRKLIIPAGQNLVFTAGVNVGTGKSIALGAMGGAIGGLVAATIYKGCLSTIDFFPEVGGTYVFRMNSDGKDCSYQFFAKPSANQRPDEVLPVAFTTREWIRAMGEAGPFCKKK
jgi:hypothetical protein